jgi:hypothetical protein
MQILFARPPAEPDRPRLGICSLTWAFHVERVTGIEPALSAWDPDRPPSTAA